MERSAERRSAQSAPAGAAVIPNDSRPKSLQNAVPPEDSGFHKRKLTLEDLKEHKPADLMAKNNLAEQTNGMSALLASYRSLAADRFEEIGGGRGAGAGD